MSARFLIADVFDGLASLEDGSVDVVITSPPFLALRSYLPADHPEKSKEIGSEATPAEFIDVLLAVTAELRRVLAPHGSICVELGDTYAGSGGGGGDYLENGWREGQQQFAGSAASMRESNAAHWRQKNQDKDAWPLSKSRTLIPQLYEIALVYGINPLTGQPSPAGQWRIRNVVTWARPNPPVGALGDKWRPATSDLIVACTSPKRYWDDLATRRPYSENTHARMAKGVTERTDLPSRQRDGNWSTLPERDNPTSGAGAPLLDYWVIPPGGYKGSHYAVFPEELVVPCVKAMCPSKVCRVCGEPSRRIVKEQPLNGERRALANHIRQQREAKGLTQKDVAAYFPSATGGVTGCVWNWENNANVPTAEQWPVLVDLLDLSDEFAHLIEGTRQWTESLVEYEHINDHPSGTTQDATGRIYNRLPARKNRIEPNVGFTDCGHDDYRPGVVLDPFAGSGTTLAVATGHGHDAIGIDLDPRNVTLARDRIGPFLFEEVGVGELQPEATP